MPRHSPPPQPDSTAPGAVRHPFLLALGARLRAMRAQRGFTRKALALAAGVSERHLANLESGVGNASVLVLLQVAQALACPLAALVGEARSSDAQASAAPPSPKGARVALIGLRGAGKSTLGRMLADDLGCAFVELSREIERCAGCSIAEIQALYGQAAYRRYERRALEETVSAHSQAVIATPGGLVSDPASFALLLARCSSVWLQAAPADHMQRVVAQGDMRPMAASREAMDDLKGILAARAAFYAQADATLDTSAQPLPDNFLLLCGIVRRLLQPPALPMPLPTAPALHQQKLHQNA